MIKFKFFLNVIFDFLICIFCSLIFVFLGFLMLFWGEEGVKGVLRVFWSL